MFQVLRQLQDCTHQDFDSVVNVGDGFIQNSLGEFFHLFGEQGCTEEFHHLEGAVNLMKIVQTKAQARGIVTIVNECLECLLTLCQRFLYFAPNPVQRDAVMVIAHNHSG